jgi:hypothetical protein
VHVQPADAAGKCPQSYGGELPPRSREQIGHIKLEGNDRMPLILAPADYARWLSDEPDPSDLMRPFPSEPMRMWPISTRVNKP